MDSVSLPPAQGSLKCFVTELNGTVSTADCLATGHGNQCMSYLTKCQQDIVSPWRSAHVCLCYASRAASDVMGSHASNVKLAGAS